METIGTAEAALILGVSSKTVTRYCSRGLLEATRERKGLVGRYHWQIKPESVEKLLKQQGGAQWKA